MTELPGQDAPVFNIEWGGEVVLTVEEIWPDGDAPANPTTDDVIAVMQKSRSVRGLARDWNLEIEGVEVNGKDSGCDDHFATAVRERAYGS